MNQYKITSYKISEIVTKSYSTSFYTASLMFNPEIRKAIFNIYGFVRFADEIVDTFLDYNQKELLDRFEEDLWNDMKTGLSLNPVLHSFILIVKQYNIEIELIKAFLQSMRNDLTVLQYNDNSSIEKYIYGSAEVVGLMCLKVFCNGNHKLYTSLENYAKSLGAAFQKVNFIRDLNEDINRLNRIYFPQIENKIFTENAKQKIIEDINKDFYEAKKGIKKLPKEAKTAVLIAYLYYNKLLKKIKKIPAETIIEKRIRVPNAVKFLIILKGILMSRLKLF